MLDREAKETGGKNLAAVFPSKAAARFLFWSAMTNAHGKLQNLFVSLLLLFAQSCPTLCDPVDCSTPGFPVLQHPLELAQTHIH